MDTEPTDEKDSAPETPMHADAAAPPDQAGGTASEVVASVAAGEVGLPDDSVRREDATPALSGTQEASTEATTLFNVAPSPPIDDAGATLPAGNDESTAAPSADTGDIDPKSTKLVAISMAAADESYDPVPQESEQHGDKNLRAAADEANTSENSERSGPNDLPRQDDARDRHEDAVPASSDTQETRTEAVVMSNAAASSAVEDAAATPPVDNEESSATASTDTTVIDIESTKLPAAGTHVGDESAGPVSQESEKHGDKATDEANTAQTGERSGPDDESQQDSAQQDDAQEDQPSEVPASTSISIIGPTSDDVASTAEASATTTDATTSNPATPPAPRRTFLSSLTAQFAPETKRVWADVFGVRYESEEASADQPDRSNISRATNSPATRPTVRVGTTRRADASEIKQRDDRIQASRQRYRDRIRQLTKAVSQPPPSTTRTSKPTPVASARTHSDCDGTSPLERSGLSLTQIRFCQERALDETCRTFRLIHVHLLNDDGPEREHSERQHDVQHGVFLTQWELEQMLRDSQGTEDDSEEGNAIDPAYAEIPIETLLQASWFLPFDQLSRLRTLVLQITRRHLNEHRLARLNRFLRNQLLWIPHSTKLQQLIIGLTTEPHDRQGGSDCERRIDRDVSTTDGRSVRRAPLQSDPAVIREFVEYIDARPRVPEPTDAIYCSFLSLQPLKLASKWRVGSVLTLQRLVFFRFLTIVIAQERKKMDKGHQSPGEHRSKRDTLASAARRKTLLGVLRRHQGAEAVKSRKQKAKIKRRRCSTVDDDDDDETEKQRSSSDQEAEDPAMNSEDDEGQRWTKDAEERIQLSGEIVVEQTVEDASSRALVVRLNKRLKVAMEKMELAMPSLSNQQKSIQAPVAAVKATFVAATAFHQRISRMIQGNIAIDADTKRQLQQLVEALDATILDLEGANKSPKTIPGGPRRTASTFPPPYPESVEENQSNSDDNDAERMFPPPYVKTTPAFWTFDPEIDPPKPSIAKLHAVRQGSLFPLHNAPTNASSSRDAASKSPGVGSYDVRRSDHLMFPERPSYSFTPASSDHLSSTSRPVSTSKSRVWKSSLAYPPPLPGREEDDNDDDDWIGTRQFGIVQPVVQDEDDSTARVEVDTQCDSPPAPTSSSRVPSASNNSDGGGETGASNTLGVSLSEALRLQQRMFVNDFVQTVASRQHRTPGSTKAASAKRSVYHRTVPPSPSNIHWQSSLEVGRSDKSRFVSRLRQRRASTSPLSPKRKDPTPFPTASGELAVSPALPAPRTSKARAKSPVARSAHASISVNSIASMRRSRITASSSNGRSVNTSIALPSPDGRVEPSAEHLAWATRVSELYAQRVDAAAAQ